MAAGDELLQNQKAPYLTLAEAAAPATPAAGLARVYVKADGKIYLKDDAGTETDLTAGGSGSVATDAIWDAKGDAVYGTGANTAARVAVGANGTRPEAASGETTGWKNSYPPGHEFDYAAITSNSTTTATTEATAVTAITGASVAYDGSTAIMVEVYSPEIIMTATAAGQAHIIVLFDGATVLGRIGVEVTPAAAAMRVPFHAVFRTTPSAASHQYIVKHYISAGTNGIIGAAAGGTGVTVPAFLRVTKAS